MPLCAHSCKLVFTLLLLTLGARFSWAVPVTRVACVGDSITQGLGVASIAQDSYPARLGTLLGNTWEVRNFGVIGATAISSSNIPYNGSLGYSAALAYRPDVVVIELGTNDTKPENNVALPDDFVSSYSNLIAKFQAVNPAVKIYACLPAPVFPSNYGITERVLSASVLPAIQQVAAQTGVPLIDLHSALTGKGRCFPDRVHPNEEGALLIARAVYRGITGLELPPIRQPTFGLSILPLGDALTLGAGDSHANGGGSGYRDRLYSLLSGAGVPFRFVGSSMPNASTTLRAAGQDFHEGHNYYPIGDLLANLDGYKQNSHNSSNDGYWLTGGHSTDREAIYPDMVLLLAGLHDVQAQTSLGTMQQRMTTLLDWFRTNRPNSQVFVSTLLPIDDALLKTNNFNGTVRAFNDWLTTTLPSRYTSGVTVVDLYSLFTDSSGNLKTKDSPDSVYLTDGIFPSHQGYMAMGDAWFAAMQPLLTSTLPTPTEAASLVVNSTDDTVANDGKTTLREAITYANNLQGNPTVLFDPQVFGGSNQVITLNGTPLPTISASATIMGSTGGVTIDAGGRSDILWTSGDTVTLKWLTFKGGTSRAVQNTAGTLIVEACTFANNQDAIGSDTAPTPTPTPEPTIAPDPTATPEPTLTPEPTTASESDPSTPLILRNCTVSGNAIGVFSHGPSLITLENCTIAGNEVGLSNGDGMGTFNLANTLVANNSQIDTDTPVATSLFSLVGGEVGLDPAGLKNNGGPTATIALIQSSPAINAGDPNFDGQNKTDQRQRNFGRVKLARLDIGAFETQHALPPRPNESYEAVEDTLLSVGATTGVLANDSAPSNLSALVASLVNAPASGTLALYATGAFTYRPKPNFNGTDSFSYRVSDGDLSTIATATITVAPINDAPSARVYLVPTFPKTSTLLTTSLPASDVDNDPLTFIYVWKKNDVFIEGETGETLDLNKPGNGNKGERISVVVVPNDGLLSGPPTTATATIVNSAPTLSAATFNGQENATLSAQLLAVDADQDPLIYSVAIKPHAGTLNLQPSGAFLYTPTANWNGTDAFQARVVDGSGVGAAAIFTLRIAPVNGAPTAVADVLAGREDVPLSIAASTLLKNDQNGEIRGEVDPLKITGVTLPANFPGTLTLDVAKQMLLFVPKLNWNGTASFTYTLQDSGGLTATASVALQVAPVNDAPTANSTSLTVISGTLAELPLQGSDPEGDALTFALSTRPLHGGAQVLKVGAQWLVRYQSKAGFTGSDSLSIIARDAKLASAPAPITLTVIPNSPPQLVGLLPQKATYTTGSLVVFEQTVRDLNGTAHLDAIALAISNAPTTLSTRAAGTLWFDAVANRFTLTHDDGVTPFAPVVLGQTLSNSQFQVTLSPADVTHTSHGLLTLRWHILFKPTFTGPKSLWSRVEDLGGLSAGFTKAAEITLAPSATPKLSAPAS